MSSSFSKNILIEKTEYKYDEKGNILEMIPYSSDGKSDRVFTYEYDEKGNKIKETFSSGFPKILEIFKYEYDGNGNLTRFYWDEGNGSISIRMMKYDNNGNKLEQLNCDKDGNPASLYKYIYEYYK